MTAIDIQAQLHQLHAERALAAMKPLEPAAAHVADLDAEIAAIRQAYVAAAVTEIATLRAELFGAQAG